VSDVAPSHPGRFRGALLVLSALGAGWLVLRWAGPPPGLVSFDPPDSRRGLEFTGEPPVGHRGTYRCPFGSGYGAYLPQQIFFPPNHPDPPAPAIPPERCFASAADAEDSGYSPAPPPPGVETVDAVYVVPVDLVHQCELASGALGLPVPCPASLPNPGWGSDPPGCNRAPFHQPCVFDGAFVLDYPGFAVPPGYVGAGVEGPHLVVSAFDPGDPLLDREGRWLRCPGGDVVSSMTLRLRGGRAAAAELVDCPVLWVPHGGHLLLRWSEGGVSYQLSVHGHTEANERLLVTLAASIVLIE
jgi:hypothetical protein